MKNGMYVVVVDTRGMSPSDIDGYEEQTYTEEYFDHHILQQGERHFLKKDHEMKCIKSKVAELCGLNLRIYFHEYCKVHSHKFQHGELKKAMSEEEEELDHTNGAATLLTFDPRTGYPEYKILGKAYVVMDFGEYPLSNHQVWGLCDLISEGRDFYHCDPDHLHSGRIQLERFCRDYQQENWGPLTIYEPRLIEEKGHPHEFPQEQMYVTDNYYRHRHDQPKQAYALQNESAIIHEEPIMMEPHRAKATKSPFGRLHFSSKPLDFDDDEHRDERNTGFNDDDSNSVPSILATTKCYHYRL